MTDDYTVIMLKDIKIAVSIPDLLFAEAESTARSMGIPRSQLFAKALEEFIDHHKSEYRTEKLNETYAGADASIFLRTSSASLESLRELTKNDAW